MSLPRRVLHVVGSLADTDGGLPSAVVSIANAQARRGHRVTIASTTGPQDSHAGLAELEESVSVQFFPRGRIIGRFNGSRDMDRWLRRHLGTFDAVNVHSVWTLPSYTTALRALLRRGRPRLIVSPHGSLEPFDVAKHAAAKKVLGPLFLRPILTRAAAVHCTAEREAETMVTYGARIRPFVATLPIVGAAPAEKSSTALRRSNGLADDRPIILHLGRIDYKKGLPYLLRAVALLPDPKPYVVIAGRGTEEYEKVVHDVVDDLGLGEAVRFPGWLTGADKAAALGGADLFALLSDNENYGISAMEATQAGLPAVVSDEVFIGPELVAAGAAVRSDRDPAAAAQVIGALLGDPPRLAEMRAAALGHSQRLRAADDIDRRYSELLDAAEAFPAAEAP